MRLEDLFGGTWGAWGEKRGFRAELLGPNGKTIQVATALHHFQELSPIHGSTEYTGGANIGC